tara:strand:- start:104 stop:463 length:360 start_codon:yes stop_codon:yes gene_type:complete
VIVLFYLNDCSGEDGLNGLCLLPLHSTYVGCGLLVMSFLPQQTIPFNHLFSSINLFISLACLVWLMAPLVFFSLMNNVLPKGTEMEVDQSTEMECYRGSSSAGADNPQFLHFSRSHNRR